MKCPQCGYENADDAAFCNLCYTVLKKVPSSAPSSAPATAMAGTVAASAPPAEESPAVDSETLDKIKAGWIAAFCCAGFTLLAILIAGSVPSLAGMVSPWALVDVVLITGLAFGIRAKSRAAATAMFIYYVVDKLGSWISAGGMPKGIFMVAIFTYYFFRAMVATYDYHNSK